MSAGNSGSGDLSGTVPAAVRSTRPGWRDPRILVGVVIMAAAVLLAARLLAAADDTVEVWAARADLPTGTTVSRDQLDAVRIRFTDQKQADRYLSASQAPPAGVLTRAVGAGELVPRDAISESAERLVEVPLSVEEDEVPVTVKQGSIVDVWVTPQTATTADKLADATRVLEAVVVVKAPKNSDSLAPSGTRQIIVGVPPDLAAKLGPALGQTSSGHVIITKQG